MSEITLSSAVRSNLLNLQQTATLLGKTQERLATGLKVNSALDNPTNFFTASSLNARSADLGRLLDSVSNATQTIAAADKGISALTKLVETAQATARQALQTAGTVEQTSVSSQATVTGSVTIAADTQAAVTGSTTIAADAQATTTGSTTIAADTTAVLTGAALTGGNQMDSVAAAGTSITLSVDGTDVTFDFYDGTAGAYAGSNVGIDVDTTGTPVDITTALGAMQTAFRSGTGIADATIGLNGGSLEVTLGSNTADSITVSGNTTAGLGLTNGTVEGPNNATIGSLSGTLTVAGNTLTFGSGGITNRAELTTALSGLTGGVTGAITGNNLVFTGSGGNSFTVGGTLDVNAAFGVAEQAYNATNSTLGSLSGTLTIAGNTLTFGSGGIQTRAALTTALSGLTGGVTGAITGNNLVFSGSNSDSFTVGGTLDVNAAFGVAEQAYDASNSTLGSLSGTLTVGGNTLTFGSGSGEINTRAELTTALGSLTGGVTGAITSNNLVFTGSGGNSFTVGGTLDASTAFGVTEQAYNATSTTAEVANPKREELRVQYNDLLDQIDQLAKDTGFNGVNLLNGDSLSVLFNEDGSSGLDISGVTFTSTGLSLSALSSGAFNTNSGINGTLDTLKTAIDSLRTQASKFGSNLSVVQTRQDFTKNMINVLETGAANLTLADTNEEAANLLALQTRQQLSSTALSLASQSDQNVLRLF